jgi:hypothetical protein
MLKFDLYNIFKISDLFSINLFLVELKLITSSPLDCQEGEQLFFLL